MHLRGLLLSVAAVFTVVRCAPTNSTAGYKFLNSKTKPYLITSMPEVNFDFGEMYGGSVPIDESDPSRTLYFIFKPAINAEFQGVKEVTIWLNGGPGCSSLEGFLEENGPISWTPGSIAPQRNMLSWANLTNMIWVDQPVGTGFSTGKINNTGEVDTAQQFLGFFKNWEKLFGISNYNIYVTGESYAGRYVPYISAAMLDAKDTTYYNLKGALVYDPVIGEFEYTQEPVVTYPFLVENNNVLTLTPAQLAKYQQVDSQCGYAALRNKYLTFPPPGHQPPHSPPGNGKCDLWFNSIIPLSEVNPCFNVYDVSQQCPAVYDPLGFTGPNDGPAYFDRSDVKAAIHAPKDITWYECGEHNVFNKKNPEGPEDENDPSPDPIQGVLPQVIEATNRVLVANGDLDFIIITNGTLMSIQNMTWNGKLGFQQAPSTPIVVNAAELGLPKYESQGTIGVQHYERGLMWAETFNCGHMQPLFQPEVTLLHLQWLLGRRQAL